MPCEVRFSSGSHEQVRRSVGCRHLGEQEFYLKLQRESSSPKRIGQSLSNEIEDLSSSERLSVNVWEASAARKCLPASV